MGYSRVSKGAGFYNYVQPFINQMPTEYSSPPLSLQVDTDNADSCAYHWRNYLNVSMIKDYFIVSVKIDPTNPNNSWVTIKHKKPPAPFGDVSRVIIGEAPGGDLHTVTQKEKRKILTIERTDLPDIPITEEMKEVFEEMAEIEAEEKKEKRIKPKQASFSMFDKPSNKDKTSDAE